MTLRPNSGETERQNDTRWLTVERDATLRERKLTKTANASPELWNSFCEEPCPSDCKQSLVVTGTSVLGQGRLSQHKVSPSRFPGRLKVFRMAENKFSSPSSSSSGAHRNSNGPQVVILKQPPSHLFADEPFQIDYRVEGVNSADNSPSSEADIHAELEPVELSILTEDRAPGTKSPSGQSSASLTTQPELRLEILETLRQADTESFGRLRCRVCLVSGSMSIKQAVTFQIRLALDKNTSPALTRRVNLVQGKLSIETSTDWTSIWYKDEGGRDKCIEFCVEATEKNEKPVKEKLPLTVTLCYATADEPIRVLNQEVLRIIGSEKKLQTERSTGRAKIRFRIEDVSKNHQGQDFLLQVAVDNRMYPGIAPAYTPSVSVRSKRNKRHRAPQDYQSHAESSVRASPPSSGGGGVDCHPVSLEGTDLDAILDAMHGVKKWADEVYTGLHPLQWQILGYARNEDGSPDFTRPYHSMSNPNSFISRMRASYMDSTRKQLQFLEQILTRSSASSSQGGQPDAYAQMVAPPHDPFWMNHSSMPPIHPMMHPLAMQPRPGYDSGYDYAPPARNYYGQRAPLAPPPPHDGRYDDSMPMHLPPAQPWLQQHQTPSRMPIIEKQATQSVLAAPTNDMHKPDKNQLGMDANETNDFQLMEAEVEYVLAKQYKSLHTRKKLGFPAYSFEKKLLGFFSSSDKAGAAGHFVHVSALDDFVSPEARQQASDILQEAIDKKNEALFCLRDWGSLGILLDRVFVFDWSKDLTQTGDHSESL